MVELLVVVAIIAILAALLLSVLGRAKDAARRTVCLNNLKQLATGAHLYADDHNNILPIGYTANLRSMAFPVGIETLTLLRSYAGVKGLPSPQDALFNCPADTFSYEYKNEYKNDSYQPKGLHTQAKYEYSSYSFNAGNIPVGKPPSLRWPGVAGLKLDTINDQTKTLLVVEFAAFLPYSWHQPGGASHYDNARDLVSFADGHAKYIKIFWDSANTNSFYKEAWQYDPPGSYEYKWSGN